MRKSKQGRPPRVDPDDLIEPPKIERGFQVEDKQREIVRNMAGFGFIEDDICLMIQNKDGSPISKPTLRKYFANELRVGHVSATYQVAGFLFKSAKEGNVAAQIFWMKTRGRWSEGGDAAGPDGGVAQSKEVIITMKDGRRIQVA